MNKKNQPQKRLGRGLESLINGGLQKPIPPSVHIDKMQIINKDEESKKLVAPQNEVKKFTPPPANIGESSVKKDLVSDLNDLLKKTQEEAREEFEEDGIILSNEKMPEARVEASSSGSPTGVFMLLPIRGIKVSPFQRRKEFAAEALKELADSIRSEGLMQPIVVRTSPEGYELIAGERRFRACQSIGMEVIPARVVNVTDPSAAVMGLIENLQRVDLNPVDEARGYGMLLSDFHMTQEQIAERVGKARTTVTNSLRLLMLEVEILGYVAKGQLSVGHAKVLLGLPEGAHRVMLARTIVEQGLSVRQSEALLRKSGSAVGGTQKTKRVASEMEISVVKDLEKRIVERFNTKVQIAHGAKGGKMVIHYKNNGELEQILKQMGV